MKKKDEPTGRRGLMALMRQAAHRHTMFDVFRDFCEMSAISVSNAVDWAQREKREAVYMETIKRYNAEEIALFPKMFGCLVDELEVGMADVLGQTFMELEISNKNTGQFFTPYSLCQVTARLVLDDTLKEKVKERGFVTVNEPACGGGAMVIAFAEAFRDAELNPQQQMHVIAQDLDPRSVHMTYVQLSLLGIPAIVECRNTISMELFSTWYTPAHILNGWNWNLRRQDAPAEPAAAAQAPALPAPPSITLPPSGEQISLFSEAA